MITVRLGNASGHASMYPGVKGGVCTQDLPSCTIVTLGIDKYLNAAGTVDIINCKFNWGDGTGIVAGAPSK